MSFSPFPSPVMSSAVSRPSQSEQLCEARSSPKNSISLKEYRRPTQLSSTVFRSLLCQDVSEAVQLFPVKRITLNVVHRAIPRSVPTAAFCTEYVAGGKQDWRDCCATQSVSASATMLRGIGQGSKTSP